MKKLEGILRSREFWTVTLLTLASIAVRFWRLGQPGEIVFDETYYAKWGQNYLQHVAFFDVHPPLGKLLTGVGVWLTDSNPLAGTGAFGWRLGVALFGVLIVPLTYYIAKKIFADGHLAKKPLGTTEERLPNATRIATLAALFVLIDGLILVQTRTSLLDSYVVTFMLATYASYLSYRDAKTDRSAYTWFMLIGVFLGLSIATKWTGLAPAGVLVFWWLAHAHRTPKINWGFAITSLVVVPFLIYTASFAFNVRTIAFWPYLVDWTKQTWKFHKELHATHPYESRWWSWLYLQRPVWYYYKEIAGKVVGIIALGNPILWWASIPALFGSLWLIVRRRYGVLLLPMLAFMAAYLPWSIIGRTEFQYYVVGGVPFMFILLAFWLDRFLSSKHFSKMVLAQAIIILAVLAFIFFYPLLTAYPISKAYYGLHVWMKSWI